MSSASLEVRGSEAFFCEVSLALEGVEVGVGIRKRSERGNRGEDANGGGDGIVTDLSDGIESSVCKLFKADRWLDDARFELESTWTGSMGGTWRM
jgi:hypothetical protein